MKLIRLFFTLFILLQIGFSSAQNNFQKIIIPKGLSKIVLLRPTGEIINELPEMVLLSDTTQLFKDVHKIVNNSFIDESLNLYFLAQNYLINKNKIDIPEPAYLALTNNQGGFAKIGFQLKQGDEIINKSHVPFIDIVEGRITGNYNRLMSITQLYPHEMGHIIYGLLSPPDTNKNNLRSVDMHYFSVRTDYSTAFNEGFAEHLENVSRLFEKNERIKNGIFSSIDEVKKGTQSAIIGFEKDFKYPFRLGYYKMSMLNWYQKFENLKRYDHAINGTVKYQNASLGLSNIEDQLSFMNTGVRQNTDELRNYIQMLSTEGVINAFFTHLSKSDLSNHYLDSSFYKAFLFDTTLLVDAPEKIFSPIQNQFMKYFFVFHNYVCSNYSESAQFVDFMEGYIHSFPSEAEAIKEIFKQATNLEYTPNLPPEMWIMVKDYQHRFLVTDPFGSITMPVYTFDLNAANPIDLMTIPGLQKEEADKIIEYRNAYGFFTNYEHIKNIKGLSDASINAILNSKFDQQYFDDFQRPDLNITALILTPLKFLFYKSLLYFLVLFGILYVIFFHKEKQSVKRVIPLMIKYYLFWFLFVLAGFIIVFMSTNTWPIFILFTVILLIINLLIFRKNKTKRHRTIFATVLMGCLIIVSLL